MQHLRIDVRGAPEGGFSLMTLADFLGTLLFALMAGAILSIPAIESNRYEFAFIGYSAALLFWGWWTFIRPRRRAARIKAYDLSLDRVRAGLRRKRGGAHAARVFWLAFNFTAALGCYIAGFTGLTDGYKDPFGVAMVLFVLNGLRLWTDKSGLIKTIVSWGMIGAVWWLLIVIWGALFANRGYEGWLAAVGYGVFLILLGVAIAISRRIAPLSQATMEEMRKRDPRPPVLFLRSFNDESQPLLGDRGPRLERVVADCVRPYGPFIGIGRPGELTPSGAARKYFADDAWQPAVKALMDEAALIVVMPGLTAGLDWEMQQLTQNGRLRKCLFAFPFAGGPARYERLRKVLADTPEGARLREVDLSAALTLHLAPDWRWAVAHSSYMAFAEYQAAIDVGVYGLLCAGKS